MTHFNQRYFLLAMLLLITEIFIALFIHDGFVRPYIGDLLVVIFIYCFIRSFFKLPVLTTAIAVLLFSYFVETMQYFKLIRLLQLEHSKLARVIIGTSFAWADIIAYSAGILLVLLFERYRNWNAVKKN